MFINWSPIRKLIWLKASGAIVPDLPWKTITGNPLSFIARTAHALKSCVVGIEPVQDLNGQANPYPPGGGKNKWHLVQNGYYKDTGQYIASQSVGCSDKIPVVAGQTYAFGSIKRTTETITLRGLCFDSNDSPVGGIISGTNSQYFIVPSGAVSVALWFTESGYTGTMTQEECDRLGFQMESGSSLTTFSPFSNICPISGFTGANVARTGKNLFDKSKTGTLGVVTWAYESGFLMKANQTYTLSVGSIGSSGLFDSIGIYKTDKTTQLAFSYQRSLTYTPASDTIVVFRFYKNSSVTQEAIDTVQLEVGSTATAYEAYNGTTYSVTWNTEAGTVYGGSLDVTTGVLTVDRHTVTINGTQSVNASSSNRFYINIAEAKTVDASNQNTLDTTICDRFKSVTWGRLSYPDGNLSCAPVYGNGIAFRDDSITTAAGWVTYFTNNPTQFSYELKTPQTYQLTAEEVSAIVGENNMWTDCATLTVEAKAMD